jgi:iron-sulfur cluster repair protein YtfE (RIC family)
MADTISRYLADDHRRCDRLLAACETAIGSGDWAVADEAATLFRTATLRHFTLEEDLLFPAVEGANLSATGPTNVMRMEHRQIRQLLDDLTGDLRRQDSDACLGDLETLHMLSQQHNAKEESVLYPMSDLSLAGTAGDLVARMEKA